MLWLSVYAVGLVPLRERNLDSVLRGRETPNTQTFTSRSITCERIDAGVEKCSRSIQRGIHIPVLLKRYWQRAPQGRCPRGRASAEKMWDARWPRWRNAISTPPSNC